MMYESASVPEVFRGNEGKTSRGQEMNAEVAW